MRSLPPGATNIEDFQCELLCALAWATDNQGGGKFLLSRLAQSQDYEFEPDWIRKTIRDFVAQDWIATASEETTEPLVSISETGRQKAQELWFDTVGNYAEVYPGRDPGVVRGKKLTFQEFKDFLLIFLCDRAHDSVDEIGERIEGPINYPYSLKKIAADDGLMFEKGWLDTAEGELLHAGMIEHQGNDEDGAGLYLVNAPAVEMAQVLIDKYFGKSFRSDDWNTPETVQNISANGINQCREHFARALKIIATSDFSQAEIAQIRGLLKACDDILELPTPKISIVKRILEMLRGVREISEHVEFIRDFLDSIK